MDEKYRALKAQPPYVVTIAGSDSCGGAGIQADIKTISATSCYAASIITALTAQNTQGVQAIYEIPAAFVKQQIESVFSDLPIKAVKIGMLHSQDIVETVAEACHQYHPPHIVLDPVMVAKRNTLLMKTDALTALKQILFPLVSLITPNIFEAEQIIGDKIVTATDQQAAAIAIGREYKVNTLIKGGHLTGTQSSDVLYLVNEDKSQWFDAERIPIPGPHGTGCTISAAIASYLAQEYSLQDAITAAKLYLTKVIAHNEVSENYLLNHFYFLPDITK